MCNILNSSIKIKHVTLLKLIIFHTYIKKKIKKLKNIYLCFLGQYNYTFFLFFMNTVIGLNLTKELNVLHIMYAHKLYPKNYTTHLKWYKLKRSCKKVSFHIR